MNEKDITAQLEKLKGLRLSDASRARIKDELRAQVRFSAAGKGVRVPEPERMKNHIQVNTSRMNTFFHLKVVQIQAFVLAALLIGAGTSYAAAGSVPGNLLYPVKVDVNEKVMGAFALTNNTKGQLQARLAGERLLEAEKLAAKGELDAKTSAEIQSRLDKHYAEATKRSSQAEAKGDIETSAAIRSSLQGTFRSFAAILSGLDARSHSTATAAIVGDIRAYAEQEASAEATTTASVSGTAEANVKATVDEVDKVINEAEDKLAGAKGQISAQSYTRIETEFGKATDAQSKARAALDSGRYQEAYSQSGIAIRVAKEVEALIESAVALRADTEVNTGTSTDIFFDPQAKVDVGIQNVGEDDEEGMEGSEDGSDSRHHDGGERERDTEDNSQSSDTNTSNSIQMNLETNTDASASTDVIDTELKTGTSLDGEIELEDD